MDFDRWQKVKELYEAALKYPSNERTRFLDEKCDCDEDLRREVKSLLAYSDEAESFLEAPAVGEVAEVIVESENAELPEGNSFSHYKIIKKIGAGGMGEVYLAKDTQLDRNVALKILLPEIAKDEDRVRRFKLEARAASALNHPNVVTIYEIGEAANKLFIAYEYVDGSTLREKIARNQLTIFAAAEIAEQIANALAVTHEAGVVHRDIKPENIMIRRDGYVKILDFGLAKRRIFKSGSEDETIEQIKTQKGIILGSIQYMSPEQARGAETDARTDIWSLGVVFYEMLTGKNPFEGATVSDSIAAILHFEPVPLHKVINNISEELEKVINKTLRKDLFERYQSVKDFLSDLKAIDLQCKQISFDDKTLKMTRTGGFESEDKAESQKITQATQFAGQVTDEQSQTKTREKAEPSQTRSRFVPLYSFIAKQKIWLILPIGLFLGIIGYFRSEIVNFVIVRNHKPPFESLQISQLTDDGNVTSYCAISPDGKFATYVRRIETGNESLIVRQISTGSLVEAVPPSNSIIHSLSFSPNGEFIYYFVNKKNENGLITEMNLLYKVPTLGGRSTELLKDSSISSKVTFAPDAKKIAFVKYTNTGTAIYIADSEGQNQQEALRNTEVGFDRINDVDWSPDGERFLLAVSNGKDEIHKNIAGGDTPIAKLQTATFDLSDRSFKILGDQAWYSARSFNWLRDGSGIVFLGSKDKKDISQIWYLIFPDGLLKQLTTDSNGFTSLDISNDLKTMIAIKGEPVSSLLSFDPISKGFRLVKGESKTPFVSEGISLTPDGKILFSKRVGTKAKIFSMDENGNNEKQITFDDADDLNPVSTRDGKYILFSSNRSGTFCIWRINSDGTNPLPLTNIRTGMDGKIEIMPDGQTILFSRQPAEGSGIRKISIDGGESELLIPNNKSYAINSKISPDGKYLAYLSRVFDINSEDLGMWIKIVDFQNGRIGRVVKRKALDFFNDTFQWSPDGKSLTYIKTGKANLWSFPIQDGEETQLTDFSSGSISNYAWSADHKRILIIRGIVNFDLVLVKDEDK
jgi:eukaryotic-like serine/threonine-protein kinase